MRGADTRHTGRSAYAGAQTNALRGSLATGGVVVSAAARSTAKATNL